jgi:capsular exopolysaccharide synthesis family protein
LLGFLVFSFFGMVFSYMRDRADSSLREPGQGYQLMGVPELGFLLHQPEAGGLLYSLPYKATPRLAWPQALQPRGRSRDSVLAIEACRAAVTSLVLPGNDKSLARLMVVTSPGPQEGKTTVTANLAVTMASMGRRVLLIDADLRRPKIPEIFSLRNERGLSSILGATTVTSLEGFVQETSIPHLSVLTSGPWTSACPNLLHSRRFAELLRQLREKYDFVLVDTPPLLPVADARVIGRLSDGVILVVRADQTTREAAAAAHQRLADDGTPVLGLILNDWTPAWSAYEHGIAHAAPYGKINNSDSHGSQ